MDQTPPKSALRSKTIWGVIVMILPPVLGLLGFEITVADAEGAATAIDGIVSGIGAILAIWGRISASRPVTLTGAGR